MKFPHASGLVFAAALALPAHAQHPAPTPATTEVGDRGAQALEVGIATVYDAALEGRLTASGEPYRAEELTAAHRTYPLGTRLRVTAHTGNSVTVSVNDRWNGGAGRVINLSGRAARELGFGSSRTMEVKLQVEQLGRSRSAPRETQTARLFPAAPAAPPAPTARGGSRSQQCADQAKILGLENEWAERHVRSCLANRPKK
jgi:peptidoglycan lytic transglycosylase